MRDRLRRHRASQAPAQDASTWSAPREQGVLVRAALYDQNADALSYQAFQARERAHYTTSDEHARELYRQARQLEQDAAAWREHARIARNQASRTRGSL